MIHDILHVIAGGCLCYILIPTAELWILVLFTSGFSALREHIQQISNRQHKQEYYHKFTDTLGWVLGSLIYYFLRKYCGLDADKHY